MLNAFGKAYSTESAFSADFLTTQAKHVPAGTVTVGRGYGLHRSERRSLRQGEQVTMLASETAVRGSSDWTTARRGERELRRREIWSTCKSHGADTMAWPP